MAHVGLVRRVVVPSLSAADRKLAMGILGDAYMSNDLILVEEGALSDGEVLTNEPGAVIRCKPNRLTSVRRLGGVQSLANAAVSLDWYKEQIEQDWWKDWVAQLEEMMAQKGHLVIRDGTKGIASGAFNASGMGDNYTLRRVEFPASLLYIGDNAFERCFNLESFSVPSNVVTIGKFAFSQCTSLHNVDLGRKLKTLGWSVLKSEIERSLFGGLLSEYVIKKSTAWQGL